MKKRVYVFLNKELSNPQKIVQSSHLTMEVARTFKMDHHPSVIVLSISKSQIDSIKDYLKSKGIEFVDFFEPLFNEVTGLATIPLTKEQGKLLQHFPTIKEKDFIVQESKDKNTFMEKLKVFEKPSNSASVTIILADVQSESKRGT